MLVPVQRSKSPNYNRGRTPGAGKTKVASPMTIFTGFIIFHELTNTKQHILSTWFTSISSGSKIIVQCILLSQYITVAAKKTKTDSQRTSSPPDHPPLGFKECVDLTYLFVINLTSPSCLTSQHFGDMTGETISYDLGCIPIMNM